jgi:hypothetical protein
MRTDVPIQHPQQLRPIGIEMFPLPHGPVGIAKATTTFEKWNGTALLGTSGGKAIFNASGAPAFAELAILRILEEVVGQEYGSIHTGESFGAHTGARSQFHFQQNKLR